MKSYDRNVKNVATEVRSFFHKTYNAIHLCGPALDLNELHDAGLMIVCSHRSMADYYLLGMLMHDMGIENLRFAAGTNLTKFPILGSKFQAFGAFDIDRDFAFSRSYIKELCDRVVGMIEDNDRIIVFPEGGRSYHGDMMELKGGVLAAAVLAHARNPEKRIFMLPITFSYERLYELPYFSLLEKGKKLRKHTNPFFKQWFGSACYFGADILAYLRYFCNHKLGRKQGDIFIDYAAPIALSDLVDIKAHFSSNVKDELFAYKKAIQVLGNSLRVKLQGLYRLLPVHLAAYCLSKHPSRLLTDLRQAIEAAARQLDDKTRNTKSIASLGAGELLDAGIRQLSVYKAVDVRNGTVHVLKPFIIDYYAASIS
jgi:glycerol-3-phosphate O-acyltransferase